MGAKQPALFDLAPDQRAPSIQARINEFKRKHGILTNRCASIPREDCPWIAVLTEPGETRSIEQLFADECRLLEEFHRIGYGTGELSAIRDLCEQQKIKCDL